MSCVCRNTPTITRHFREQFTTFFNDDDDLFIPRPTKLNDAAADDDVSPHFRITAFDLINSVCILLMHHRSIRFTRFVFRLCITIQYDLLGLYFAYVSPFNAISLICFLPTFERSFDFLTKMFPRRQRFSVVFNWPSK